jgi:hypothetical protein
MVAGKAVRFIRVLCVITVIVCTSKEDNDITKVTRSFNIDKIDETVCCANDYGIIEHSSKRTEHKSLLKKSAIFFTHRQ